MALGLTLATACWPRHAAPFRPHLSRASAPNWRPSRSRRSSAPGVEERTGQSLTIDPSSAARLLPVGRSPGIEIHEHHRHWTKAAEQRPAWGGSPAHRAAADDAVGTGHGEGAESARAWQHRSASTRSRGCHALTPTPLPARTSTALPASYNRTRPMHLHPSLASVRHERGHQQGRGGRTCATWATGRSRKQQGQSQTGSATDAGRHSFHPHVAQTLAWSCGSETRWAGERGGLHQLPEDRSIVCPTRSTCRALGVSQSWYYKWRDRAPTAAAAAPRGPGRVIEARFDRLGRHLRQPAHHPMTCARRDGRSRRTPSRSAWPSSAWPAGGQGAAGR